MLLLSLGGGPESAQIWGVGIVGALILLATVYLVTRIRARKNAEVIGDAVVAMSAALTDEAAPQRALLGAMADLLRTQDRIAARIEVDVHELALSEHEVPQPEEFLKELIDLPEPQLLIIGFLAQHGASPGSEAAFATVAADFVRAATIEIFGDLPGNASGGESVELERLLLRAADGRIATVAEAVLEAPGGPGPVPYRAPRVADLDAASMAALVRRLDQLIRRHLRLATLLHGQAESILRTGRDQPVRPGGWLARARQRLIFARPRRAGFRADDLDLLVAAFDAAGETVDTATDYLAEGRPTDAMHLLAGLRVPVPAGLPGRIYHQESLAQVRPLAAFGVWHRLALCRWTAMALQAMIQAELGPPASPRAGAEPDDGPAMGDGEDR